jgi:hypothetical protein
MVTPGAALADIRMMTMGRSSLSPAGYACPAAPRRWSDRLMLWAVSSRGHRVLCLVLGIWILNLFDLALTLIAHRHGLLEEVNPLARNLLESDPRSLVYYKIGLVFLGTLPIVRFRHARIAELGALTVLAAYVLLAMRWNICYELYTLAATNNVHAAELDRWGAAFGP